MKKLGAIILVILVLSVGLAPSEVFAQSGCNFNHIWETIEGTPAGISFQESPWTSYTELNPLTREDYENVVPVTPGTGWIIIAQTFESVIPCTPTQVVVTWRRGSGNTGEFWLDTSDDGDTWTERVNVDLGFTSILTPQVYTWSNTGSISFTHVRFRLRHPYPELHQFRMDASVEPNPEFLYPLLERDEWTDSQYQTGFVNPAGAQPGKPVRDDAVVSMSNSPGAPVYNIADGTVTEVVNLPSTDPVDCITTETGGQEWLNIFLIPCNFRSNALSNSYVIDVFLGSGYWWGDDRNLWRVSVATENGTIRYVVASADSFVREGTSISAGCQLGETLPATFINLQIEVGGVSGVNKRPTDEGYAFVERLNGGEPAELLDYMVSYPAQGSACNVPDSLRNCIGNTDFTQESNWAGQGAVTFQPGGGVLIGSNSSIASSRPFNLNANRLPQVTVSARNATGSNTLRLQIGQTTNSFSPSNSFQQYQIGGSSHSPDSGDYFSIAIYNDGQGLIEVEYICVSHTLQPDEETPEIPPPPHKDGCYFTNPYMDNDSQGWNIYAGDVTRLSGGLGVEDDGEFGQGGIILFPNGESAQTYTLTLRANLWAFSSYVPTPDDATDISITYSLWGGSHTTLETHTVGEFVQSEFGVMTYQTTFDVSEDGSGTIVFRVTVGTPATGLRGLVIRDACLEAGDTTNGDPSEEFPGFDDEGESGTPGDRPFPEYCAEPDYSGENGFVWLWGHLNSFFQCQLMVILNDIYEAIMNFFRMVGWFIRWVMMVIQMFINWISYQVLPWLAGYMVNIMGSQPNEVLYTSNPGQQEVYESCNWYDIFCHARNLFDTVGSVINGIGDFLGGLIQGVIDIIGWLLQGIVDVIEWLWEQLVNLFNGIINIIRGLFEGLFQILQWIWQAITSVIEFIVNIATVIINALVSLVSTIVSWIVTIVQVIGAIITGASSATPQTISGLPSCSTPTSHALCLIYWALENTILAGLGATFIPLLTAIFAIRFAIWYIAKWRATLVEVVTTS